jgi:uncharacterized membrane protein
VTEQAGRAGWAEEERERERDLDRLLTFVDAIVAIAITLLVLPLVDLARDVNTSHTAGYLLRHHSNDLWSFVLSFFVIARIWQGQHATVSPLLKGTSRVTSLLMLWCFTIVVLPFPTALVAREGHEAITKLLYVGTMIASLTIVAAVRGEIARHPELTDGSRPPSAAREIATPILMAVALAVMLIFPSTSYWPMLVLVLDGQAIRLMDRLTKRRTH